MQLKRFCAEEEELKIGDATFMLTTLTARISRQLNWALRDMDAAVKLAIVHGVVGVENLTDADGKKVAATKDESIGQVLYNLLDNGGPREAHIGWKIATTVINRNSEFSEDESKNSKG